MSSPLLRGRDLIGHPVVDVKSGENVAEIRDVVFDATDGHLTGFTLNESEPWAGRLHEVLPIAQVTSVGTGAVMIADFDALLAPSDGTPSDEISAAAQANDEVVDDLVVTESGRSLGTVRDVVIVGGESPRVVAFEIAGGEAGSGFIPMSRQGGVSASALIVPDEYEARLRNDIAGLSEQIDELSKETS